MHSTLHCTLHDRYHPFTLDTYLTQILQVIDQTYHTYHTYINRYILETSSTMKSISFTILLALFTNTASAFAPHGLTSVCTREEVSTGYSSYAPNAFTKTNRNKGTNMAMPPFLTNLAATKDKDGEVDVEVEEELSETKKLLKQVKEAGTAGIISYALWELAFWTLSVPVCVFAYYELVGHMPDFTNKEDLEKLGGEAFAFVNFARFAVPLRIGLALSTTSWIQGNVVDKYFNKKDENVPKEE